MSTPSSPAQLLSQATAVLAQALGRVAAHADEEAVHDARVATRRLDALLHILATSRTEKRVAKARRRVRDIRRALGTPRNLEVALLLWERVVTSSPAGAVSRAQSTRVATELRRRRDVACTQAALDATAASARVLKTLQDLLEVHGARLGAEAHARFSDVGDRVLQSARRLARREAWTDLHRLRIRFKKLRYATEWAQALGLHVPPGDVGKDLKRVQDAVGDAMDAHVGWPLFKELAPSLQLNQATLHAAEALRKEVALAAADWVERHQA
jgi:CHAD domain-containing protein